MSDPALPPPRSSPDPAIERSEHSRSEHSRSKHSEDDIDTIEDHKSFSVTGDGGSGDSESKALGKQRRKRTRPEDQAILEAEYKHNPKPNKAARADIVEKVSLNEKEVQIWFQNRRQINRRKSRPLLPHEIAAFGLGGMVASSSDPASVLSSDSSQGDEAANMPQKYIITVQDEVESSQEAERQEPEIKESIVIENLETREAVLEEVSHSPSPQPKSASELQALAIASTDEVNLLSLTETVSKSFSSTPGYLANRWNSVNSSFTPPSSHIAAFSTPLCVNPTQPSSCPERIERQNFTPASRVRLSMSLNGKAELVEADSSPSPPRIIPPRPTSSGGFVPVNRMRSLQRSQSALPIGLPTQGSASNSPSVHRLPTGRSRDVRTWEFCCDADARDELTTQAENESIGSAVAAISLLRSATSLALKLSSNKRNAPSTNDDLSKLGKKPKLGRSASSLPKLQNTPSLPSKALQNIEFIGKDRMMRSPSGDSDKENWVPKENGVNPRRRPLPTGRIDKKVRSKSVLGDNLNVPAHAIGFGGAGKRRRKAKHAAPEVFEDQENAAPASADVENFMRGEISPSKKGDLDCVQGLLSLSQGNWR